MFSAKILNSKRAPKNFKIVLLWGNFPDPHAPTRGLKSPPDPWSKVMPIADCFLDKETNPGTFFQMLYVDWLKCFKSLILKFRIIHCMIYLLEEKEKIVKVRVKKKKAGPRVSCPQNLVRAHKMLSPTTQMALENVSSFQYLIYKRYKKNQIWPWG